MYKNINGFKRVARAEYNAMIIGGAKVFCQASRDNFRNFKHTYTVYKEQSLLFGLAGYEISQGWRKCGNMQRC